MRLLAIALLVLFGCKERPTEKPEPEPPNTAPWDGGARPGTDASADARGNIAELAGTWRGELNHPRYGQVRGDVVIDGDGNISYTVQGEGSAHSGVFRILRWTGSELEVKDQGPAAGTYKVKASLSGPRMELQVEPVGKVVLVRAGGKPIETP
ncbi:MAG: hypothetical protein KJO07_14040 [Deltaproteobacteria bacterium]|nr:hypothetical protein [Deltaproteobacteria bacterium]